MKDISVIIVNYNAVQLVSDCIDSVYAGTVGIDFEVILVDNGSTDGSKEKFSSDSRIKYIYNEDNRGFGHANNIGVSQSSGRNILFLNPDTLVRGNAIGTLCHYIDANPEAGACGGNLFTRNGTPNHSYMLHRPGIISDLERFFEIKPEIFNRSGKPKEVGSISGAGLVVRKSVLDEVGGFDESFFLFFEETELCYRIARAKYKIMSVPEAEIVHFGNAVIKDNGKEKFYYESRAKYLDLTHNRLSRYICNLIWGLTVYSRIIINIFNKERLGIWQERRKLL